jgi:hypothetical protein
MGVLAVTAAIFCPGTNCTPTSWDLVKVLVPDPGDGTGPYDSVGTGDTLAFVLDSAAGSLSDYTVKLVPPSGTSTTVGATKTRGSGVFFTVPSGLLSNTVYQAQLYDSTVSSTRPVATYNFKTRS